MFTKRTHGSHSADAATTDARVADRLGAMKFRTTVLLGGRTATGMVVPDDVIAALDSGRQPSVRITIGGHTYRTTVASRAGQFLLPLSAENREAAGVAAGDEVDVDIELDTAPREVAVPAELAAALDAEPAARRTFDGLSNSNKSWHTYQVENAKTDETRQRRIAKSIEALRDGRIR